MFGGRSAIYKRLAGYAIVSHPRVLGELWCMVHRMDQTIESKAIMDLLAKAEVLAQQYQALTGKPLGITGEVAEYEASRILGVKLTPGRQAGYDAVATVDAAERRLQIKIKRMLLRSKSSQRLASIDVEKDFDALLLVLLDGDVNATFIYEADVRMFSENWQPGSISRNE